MKSINNKVLFGAAKKFLAVLVSLNFLFPLQASAETHQNIKSRDEIKIMLTSSDKYIKTAGVTSTLVWSLVVVAVGRLAYGFGKEDKGIKKFEEGLALGKKDALRELESAFRKERIHIEAEGFSRGFSAGQESLDATLDKLLKAGKKIGYKQGFDQGFKHGYGNKMLGLAPDYKIAKQKAVLTRAEKQALADFERQVRYLEVKLSTSEGADLAKRKMMTLIMQASNQAAVLKTTSDPEEIMVIRNELLTTMERMSEAKMPDVATKTVVKEYVKELSSLVRSKGGALGLSAAAVLSVGAMFVFSQEAQSSNISNTRLLVERELSRTLKEAPELFAVKAISLKNTYGLDVVSSVLYEHQEALPTLQQQLNYFQSVLVRNVSSEAVKSFGLASPSVKDNKQQLLKSFSR